MAGGHFRPPSPDRISPSEPNGARCSLCLSPVASGAVAAVPVPAAKRSRRAPPRVASENNLGGIPHMKRRSLFKNAGTYGVAGVAAAASTIAAPAIAQGRIEWRMLL